MLTYYFRITPDNRLLFGGRARFALSSPDSDVKSAEILRKAMLELFPYLPTPRWTTSGAAWWTSPWTRWFTRVA